VPSAPSVEAILKRNRDRAAELARKAGAGPTRKLLEKAAADLSKRIGAHPALRKPGVEPFTLAQMKATLAQVQEVLRPLQGGLKGMIVSEARVASEAAASGALDYLRAAEQHYTGINIPLPLREAGMLDASVVGADASVLRRLSGDPRKGAGIMARYGLNVIGDFEDELRQRFLQRKPWSEVRDELVNRSPFLQGQPAFWAERIVRTEVMGANNRAGWEVMRRADDELGDVVKILSCPFDDRTGADSIAIHGQIRRTEEPFDSWFGQAQHPPDRPNDRASVVPHRVAWPIPEALQPRPWSEVTARWRKEGRKGAPPPRPLDSTVDRKLFGRTAAPVAPSPKGGD
jgi:hypothetical protein